MVSASCGLRRLAHRLSEPDTVNGSRERGSPVNLGFILWSSGIASGIKRRAFRGSFSNCFRARPPRRPSHLCR